MSSHHDLDDRRLGRYVMADFDPDVTWANPTCLVCQDNEHFVELHARRNMTQPRTRFNECWAKSRNLVVENTVDPGVVTLRFSVRNIGMVPAYFVRARVVVLVTDHGGERYVGFYETGHGDLFPEGLDAAGPEAPSEYATLSVPLRDPRVVWKQIGTGQVVPLPVTDTAVSYVILGVADEQADGFTRGGHDEWLTYFTTADHRLPVPLYAYSRRWVCWSPDEPFYIDGRTTSLNVPLRLEVGLWSRDAAMNPGFLFTYNALPGGQRTTRATPPELLQPDLAGWSFFAVDVGAGEIVLALTNPHPTPFVSNTTGPADQQPACKEPIDCDGQNALIPKGQLLEFQFEDTNSMSNDPNDPPYNDFVIRVAVK